MPLGPGDSIAGGIRRDIYGRKEIRLVSPDSALDPLLEMHAAGTNLDSEGREVLALYGGSPDGASSSGSDVNVLDYGVLPGLPGQRAGVLAAKTVADTEHRAVLFPGGATPYLIEGAMIAFTGANGSFPRGDGYAVAVIQFTDANGGFSIGDPTSDGFGSPSGLRGMNINGLSLWGGSGPGSEVCVTPLKVTQAVQSVLSNIEVKYAAGDGIVLEQSQNLTLINVNAQDNLGSGLVMNRGTGGHALFKCEFSDNHKINVRVQETAHRTGGYQRPSDIHFYGCIIERLRRMTDANYQASLLVTAGNTISFHGCNLVSTSGTLDGSIVEVAPLRWPTLTAGTSYATNLKFTDCWFFGSQNNVAIDAFRFYGSTEVTFSGHNTFQNPGDADRGYGGAGGALFAMDDSGNVSINNYGTLDSAYNVPFRNLPITVVTTADVTLPVSTLPVSSGDNLPASGTVTALDGRTITYSGTTSNQLLSCTGGTGLLPAGSYVSGGPLGTQVLNKVMRTRFGQPVQITRSVTGDDGLILGVDGESGSRVLIKPTGLYLGDGSSFNTSTGFVLTRYDSPGRLGIVGGLRLSSGTNGRLTLVRQSAGPSLPASTEATFYTLQDGSKTRLMMMDDAGIERAIATTNVDTTFGTPGVGASPWTYQNNSWSRQSLIIRGGTVSLIEYSRDGTNFEDVGIVAGKLEVESGDYLRVTYTVAPTVKRISAAR